MMRGIRGQLKKIQLLLEESDRQERKIFSGFLEQWIRTKNLQFFTDLEQERDIRKKTLQICRAFNNHQHPENLLAEILDQAVELAHAERGFVLTAPNGEVAVARNFDKEWVEQPQYKISTSLARKVLIQGKIFVTGDAQQQPEIKDSGSVRKLGLRSVLCLPLTTHGKTMGALYLDNRFCAGAFDDSCREILQIFVEQAALALYDASLRRAVADKHRQIENLVGQWDSQLPPIIQKIETTPGLYQFGNMISRNQQMAKVFQIAARAASSGVPILICGESGTGKSVLARAIHTLSKNNNGPFVEENCAALPENLLESELFGYVKGAFTGAQDNRRGLLQEADGGVLFLDEIGEMSPAMQAKLLKVLEDKSVRPLGCQKRYQVDIAIITATHRDLQQMVADNAFREDLWYRLRVIELKIPPLRKRPEDIPLLAQNFLQHYSDAQNKKIFLSSAAAEKLTKYSWPGNIRQLENELKRIVACKEPNQKIETSDIAPDLTKQADFLQEGISLKEATRRFEADYIRRVLQQTKGNKSSAAKILGLSRRSLYNKLESMEIDG